MSDSLLRHLRDALVLTEAAIRDASEAADQATFDHAVRARVHLRAAIERTEAAKAATDDPPIGSVSGHRCF